jgi:hypothetical protein
MFQVFWIANTEFDTAQCVPSVGATLADLVYTQRIGEFT